MSWHQLAMSMPPANLHISRNLQEPSQMPCMMGTSMQKKRSAVAVEPLNKRHKKHYAKPKHIRPSLQNIEQNHIILNKFRKYADLLRASSV